MTGHRNGSMKRRRLEYAAVLDQVARNKAGFIARIQRNTEVRGQCYVWTGAIGAGGYGRMNVRMKGDVHVSLRVHSVALMCQLGRPILKGHEAGHTCGNRACIRHVVEQSWQDNMKQVHSDAAAEKPGLDVPF